MFSLYIFANCCFTAAEQSKILVSRVLDLHNAQFAIALLTATHCNFQIFFHCVFVAWLVFPLEVVSLIIIVVICVCLCRIFRTSF